jgi:LemA protein
MNFSAAYWIVFAFGIGLLLLFLLYYNRFMRNRIRRKETLHNVDLFLKRQNELLGQFRDLLERLEMPAMPVVEEAFASGTKALETEPVPGKAGHLASADRSYLAFMEEARKLKELRKQPDFNRIIDALEKNAVELQGARRYFNALVRDFNILTETLPSAIVAIALRFRKADFLSDPANSVTP